MCWDKWEVFLTLKAADFCDLANPPCRDFIVLPVFKSSLAFIDSISWGFPAVGMSPRAFIFLFFWRLLLKLSTGCLGPEMWFLFLGLN